MEASVAVLRAEFLVVVASPCVALVVAVLVIECARRKRSVLNCASECLGSHLRTRWFCGDETVLAAVRNGRIAPVVRGVGALGQRTNALRCSTGGRVRDCDKGDDSSEDDRGSTGATRAEQRVALLVVGLHRHGRHGKVSAVDGDHGRLSKTGLRVVFLDGWVDGDYRDDEEEKHVDGDGSLVHGAAGACEEYVHDDCEGDGADVHAERAAKENPAPDL